ncbi:MAG TPA: hypothetical protein VNJ04_15340 [Gemmatimonadaceae bacterium]|nr:hypothetical protein [Gemmatimonadaceae bacterium]
MNELEQRTHRTVTQALERRIGEVADDTALVIAALDERVANVAQSTVEAIEREREQSALQAQMHRQYVDTAYQILEALVREVHDRGFWGRLNWAADRTLMAPKHVVYIGEHTGDNMQVTPDQLLAMIREDLDDATLTVPVRGVFAVVVREAEDGTLLLDNYRCGLPKFVELAVLSRTWQRLTGTVTRD